MQSTRGGAWTFLLLLASAFFLVSSTMQLQCEAQNNTVFPADSYYLWTTILQTHLDFSNPNLTTVNYTTLSMDPNFAAWINLLPTVNTNLMSCDESLAFFINVYNALAMNMIISNPCSRDIFGNCSSTVSSIRDIGPVFKSVWHLPAGVVNNVTYSLEDIEDLLRTGNTTSGQGCTKNPQIHSAIVCASASCPNLGPTAYYPWNITAMLENSMTTFLSSPKGIQVDEVNTVVSLSAIFSWFQSDFVIVNATGVATVLVYLAEYDTPYQGWLLQNPNATVIFMPYNWTLNGDISCSYCATRACYPFWAFIVTIAGIVTLALGVYSIYRIRKRRSGYEGIQ